MDAEAVDEEGCAVVEEEDRFLALVDPLADLTSPLPQTPGGVGDGIVGRGVS